MSDHVNVNAVYKIDVNGGDTDPFAEVESETIFGLVTNCSSLNVRCEPNGSADVLCSIPRDSEVEVLDENGDYYFVITATGVEGFCVKEYITFRK